MCVAEGSSPGSWPACQLGLKLTWSTVRKVSPVRDRVARRITLGDLKGSEGSETRECARSEDTRRLLSVGESRDSRSSLGNGILLFPVLMAACISAVACDTYHERAKNIQDMNRVVSNNDKIRDEGENTVVRYYSRRQPTSR